MRIQLAARLRRPRHAHRDAPPAATPASPATGAGGGVRQDQRHRAARAHRGLQGLLGDDAAPAARCFSSDSVAAIDQAVADGVDVINFSISGIATNFLDPVEVAFLFAADAGVFVAASAGNSGPTASTVAHPGPWLTTVAAGTHNRDGVGSVTLGNGATYTGASFASAVGLDAADRLDRRRPAGRRRRRPPRAVLRRRPATAARRCSTRPRSPARSCVCDRGINARVNKSLAVAAGRRRRHDPGQHRAPTTLNADLHSVPTVHVADTDGAGDQGLRGHRRRRRRRIDAGDDRATTRRRR